MTDKQTLAEAIEYVEMFGGAKPISIEESLKAEMRFTYNVPLLLRIIRQQHRMLERARDQLPLMSEMLAHLSLEACDGDIRFREAADKLHVALHEMLDPNQPLEG